MEDEFDCVKEVGRFWKLSPNVRLPYLGGKERVLNFKKKGKALNFTQQQTLMYLMRIRLCL